MKIVVSPFWEGDTVHVMTYSEFKDEYADCAHSYEVKTRKW